MLHHLRRLAPIIAALCFLVPHAGIAPAAARASAPLIAVAIKGDIYVMRADGQGMRRLTTYGMNSAPQLSPRQRLIAYLSAPRGYVTPYGAPSTHNLWLIGADGSAARRITPLNPHTDRGALAWAPDGQHLAYIQGRDLMVYNVPSGATRAILRLPAAPYRADGVVAWSPDSTRLAVSPAWSKTASPDTLHLELVGADGANPASITVTFPAALLGASARPPGSVAWPFALDWTADGAHLLVATQGKGEGSALTGIWRVPVRGGAARLQLGTAAGIAQPALTPAPIAQATHFLLSPARTRLATDAGDRLWVGLTGGGNGSFHALGSVKAPGKGCVLAQYDWLADGSGFAYVITCAGSGTPVQITSTLWSVRLDGGTPRRLVRVHDPNQRDLQLATAYRCVECGA